MEPNSRCAGPQTMRFLGIDPGLQITGYGAVALAPRQAEPALIEAGVIRLSARAAVDARLLQLHEDLLTLCREVEPDVIVVEKVFSHYRHVLTAIQMAHARGVVLLAARQSGAAVDELAATEVKKATTGNGHASKRQVQESIRQQFGLAQAPHPPDVSDAVAIALCAARRAVVPA